MLGYSAPSTILVPNDTFSESCRRDISNDALFGADTLVDVEQWSFENRSTGCVILRHLRYMRVPVLSDPPRRQPLARAAQPTPTCVCVRAPKSTPFLRNTSCRPDD